MNNHWIHIFYGTNNRELDRKTIRGGVGVCAKETLPSTSINLIDVKSVSVDGLRYDIPTYNSDIQNKLNDLNNVDFDLVVFEAGSNPKGTVVPLATPTELSI